MVPPPPPPPAPPPPPGAPPSSKKTNAPSTSSSAPNRGALLADIEKKKTLKKTVTNDRSAPIIDSNNNNKIKNATQTALRPGGPPMGTTGSDKNMPNGLVRPNFALPSQTPNAARPSFSPPPPESPRARPSFAPPSQPNVRQNFTPPQLQSPNVVRPNLSTSTTNYPNKKPPDSAVYSIKNAYNRQPSVEHASTTPTAKYANDNVPSTQYTKRANQVDNESGGTISVSQLRNQISGLQQGQSSTQKAVPANQAPLTRKVSQKMPPPPPSPAMQPSFEASNRTSTSAAKANNEMFSKPYQTLKPAGSKNRSALHRTGSQENINQNRSKPAPPPPPPRIDSIKPSGSVRPAPPPPPAVARPSAAPPPPPSVQNRISQGNVTLRTPMNNGTPSKKPSMNGYVSNTSQNHSLSNPTIEERFAFRTVQTLPEPDNYSQIKKIYNKKPKGKAPPPPTR